MSLMRFETHRVSEYMVEMLKRARSVREVTVDGGDIVEFMLASGETARLYLIESPITLYEIKSILEPNTAEGVHTLFLLWCDMLLPGHGYRYRPEDWMAALLSLYGDRIYAYDFNGPDIYIFPVHFDGAGYEREVRFGYTVNPEHLRAETVVASATYMSGSWRVASFAGSERQTAETIYAAVSQSIYAILGVEPGATRAAIKSAYRRLARLYHPDINADPEANARMQQINNAYAQLLDEMDD